MMSQESSRNLHNFTLPPHLNWGNQRILRCSNSSDTKRRRFTFTDDNNITTIRHKLINDLRSQVDTMRATFLTPHAPPWNLRTRRAACNKEGLSTESVNVSGNEKNCSMISFEEDKDERERFCVSLSRREIEEDFGAMVGRRPPRKPKKRPRYVQKELDNLFPGLWLSEVTADMYKVDETPEPGK